MKPFVLAMGCLLLGGCGASSPPASSVAAPGGACELQPVGPLIGYTYQPARAAPAGGQLADGVYDLVALVDHRQTSGEWSANAAPAHRVSMRFTTIERSENHIEGRLEIALSMPPASRCSVASFATMGTWLRIGGGTGGTKTLSYSVTPDGFTLTNDAAPGEAHVTQVFRRRL